MHSGYYWVFLPTERNTYLIWVTCSPNKSANCQFWTFTGKNYFERDTDFRETFHTLAMWYKNGVLIDAVLGRIQTILSLGSLWNLYANDAFMLSIYLPYFGSQLVTSIRCFSIYHKTMWSEYAIVSLLSYIVTFHHFKKSFS